MWTTGDRVEAYILRYKEELFKHSENTQKNQELVTKLRNYFKEAEERGETHLNQALEKLASPSLLARRHLRASGIKVRETKAVFFYLFVSFTILIGLLIIGGLIFSLWFLPDMTKKIAEEDFNYSFHFEETFYGDSGIEKVQGNYPDATNKRLIIEGQTMNLQFDHHQENFIQYDCKWDEDNNGGLKKSELFSEQGENIIFQLSDTNNALSCEFLVPESLKLNVSSQNLRFQISKVVSELNLLSQNAYIDIGLAPDTNYNLDLRAERALVLNQKKVPSSSDGVPILIQVENGKIDFNP